MSFLDIFNLLDSDNFILHEDYIERLKVCNKCEFRIQTNLGIKIINNCALCGCFNIEKAKLKESAGGNCPADRWEKLNN